MKLKVAIIGVKGLPATGGAARAWENITNELKDTFDFTIYSVDSHTKICGLYNNMNQIVFKSTSNPAFNTFQYYLKSMLHCLIKADYDIVIVNHTTSAFIIPPLRIKYNVLARTGGLAHLDKKWNPIVRFLINQMTWIFVNFATEVVCVSKDQAKFLENKYSKKIESIPNGVCINNKLINRKSDNGDIVFAAARIIEIKGLHILLSALKEINFSGKLIVVGSLKHGDKYINNIKSLANDLNVIFLGLIKDKKQLLQIIADASLFIFPSETEAMSNMLLEVTSVKTPIIASDIVDNKSIFNDDEVQFFKVNDYKSLSNNIIYAMNNKSIMTQKASLAFEKVNTDYNIKNTAIEYKKLIIRSSRILKN